MSPSVNATSPSRPRANRVGLRVESAVEHIRTGKTPNVQVYLEHVAYPREGGQAFAPLRIPERARVVVDGVDAGLIERARLQATLTLTPGTHVFPLADGPGLHVQIAEGTTVSVAAEVGPPPHEAGGAGALLTSVDVEFYPPLAMPRILTVLAEVQQLFLDKHVAALLRGVAPDRMIGLLEAVGFGLDDALLGGTLQSIEVRLARVSGRPKWRPYLQRWDLELAFSGELRLLDRVQVPFHDVVLPPAVLPVPGASLELLLSSRPLASGELRFERLHALPIARAALRALQAVEGRLRVDGDLPSVSVASQAVDRTKFQTQVHLPAGASLDGDFRISRDGNAWTVEVLPLSLSFREEDRERVQLRVAGQLKVDLEHADGGPLEHVDGRLECEILPGSVLTRVEASLRGTHPLAVGGTGGRCVLRDMHLRGGMEVRVDAGHLSAGPLGDGFAVEAALELPDEPFLQRARSTWGGSLDGGTLAATLKPHGRGWDLQVHAQGLLHQHFEMQVAPIPELRIDDSHLRGTVEARVSMSGGAILRALGGAETEMSVAPRGELEVTLSLAEATLAGRRVSLPEGTTLIGRWQPGEVSSSQAQDFAFDLTWDLHGEPCLLHGADRAVSLLTDALRQGALTVCVSPGGRFSFRGEQQGLYGVRFFNALLDPAGEAGHLLEILNSDDALSHVQAAIEVFDAEWAQQFVTLRKWAKRLRDHVQARGIARPGDLVPRHQIAGMLSRVLVDDDSLEARIEPLVRDLTECRGLDLRAAKDLLYDAWGDRRLDYEIDGVLRWLDLVTAPSEPLPRPVAVEDPPLVENPLYLTDLQTLPSADELYRAASPGPMPADLLARIADLAPELSLHQIDHLLAHVQSSWDSRAVRRLRHVRQAKRRVATIAEGWGGIAHAAQASTIASFLGEAVGPLPFDHKPSTPDAWPPPCALGPRDVAVLLHAGIVEGHQGLQSQINNRLLIELLRASPSDLTRHVLIEMSQQVPRILTGALFAFLNQDQDELQEPLDLPAFLQEQLGLPVPRQADYLAGGRKVRQSYYEALARLADAVMAQGGPYLARRSRLLDVHRPPPPMPQPRGRALTLEKDARKAIAAADKLARKLEFQGATGEGHTAATHAYHQAFHACGELLTEVPDGFQLPWFKDFWQRNEEALKVLSVVRNVQDDVDDVRHWLRVQAGRDPGLADQDLVEAVARSLYYHRKDQDEVLADPLTRLLIEEPAGAYDFTIVSCMGVVTDGAKGRELEESYRRVAKRHGVKVIRAHTGLFRSLEYNAAAILRGIERTRTPWGIVGYSQGCANALLAESFLWSGTPKQRALLDRFVARNLLFSAVNGAAHGASGSVKLLRAMVDGERFLKHYQATWSREVVEIFMRGLKSAMESTAFVDTLAGTHSLSLERARLLHRDRQFVPGIPTSTTRGIADLDKLPEALEYLYFAHDRLLPEVPHDSQVPADEAIGQASRVHNAWTEVLARADMGSRIQATHHWSPLTAEVEFLTTDRDRARAAYQGPKDRHVFPWLWVNGRFGRIGRIQGPG